MKACLSNTGITYLLQLVSIRLRSEAVAIQLLPLVVVDDVDDVDDPMQPVHTFVASTSAPVDIVPGTEQTTISHAARENNIFKLAI